MCHPQKFSGRFSAKNDPSVGAPSMEPVQRVVVPPDFFHTQALQGEKQSFLPLEHLSHSLRATCAEFSFIG
jgi:hypothetical protein